jgi:teichuronic acid biosynthesis glycosyltransferase TuaC
MKVLTVTNLYPRPDHPTRGMFNAQLFREMASILKARGASSSSLSNICLVPEWRLWRWPAIRRWTDPGDANFETRYLPVFYIPLFGRRWTAAFYRRGLARIRDLVEAHDVLFASWLHPDGTAVAGLARDTRQRAWLMALGSDVLHLDNPAHRPAMLQAAADSTGLICVCQPLADSLQAAGLAPGKIHVVPNGVDSSRFRFREKEASRGELLVSSRKAGHCATIEFLSRLEPADQIVLFAGNLVDVKAPDLLLRAFSEISRGETGNAAVHLAIIGSGPMRRALESLVAELKAGGRVHFIGNVSHEMMPVWMNAADCLALSSRSEGMPNVVLEALASGLPVVCTRVGACPQMTADEPGARVVDVGDAAAMRQALGELLNLDIDRNEMAGRHGATTWHHQAERIMELLQS